MTSPVAFVALQLLALLLGLADAAVAGRECAYLEHRLPGHILPQHYDLVLDVDMVQEHNYKGVVSIQLVVNASATGGQRLVPGNVIALHANPSLEITQVHYRDLEASPALLDDDMSEHYIGVVDVCRHEENELLVVTLAQDLVDGATGELIVSFEGDFRTDMTGLYRSAYETQAGAMSYHVSSDFEPDKARKAFPCFDEPSLKATFDITILRDPSKLALANAAVLFESTVEDAKTGRRKLATKYTTTPIMSTYLVALVVGEFDRLEEVIFGGRLTLRAYTPLGKSEQARFALETAVKAIAWLEEYFGIPFPLDKLDMITVPEYKYGAMENWGLVIFAQSSFLFDQENSSAMDMGHIARTVVHELAHHWFGNLVTPKWWNDVWLSEGFAAWMEVHLTQLLYPHLEGDQNYLIETYLRALDADAAEDTRSIRVREVGRNLENMFDDITYKKSSVIIKSVHDDYIGAEKFRAGIRSYMKKNAYSNTEASDLWSELKKASGGSPVDKLLASWIEQPGHPLVIVRLALDDNQRSLLLLEQRRDWPRASLIARNPTHQSWIIPVTMLLGDGKGRQELMTFELDQPAQVAAEVKLPDWFDPANNQNHWLKVNAGSRGFYRVVYQDQSLFRRLRQPCKMMQLASSDRIGLIEELLALQKTGLVETDRLQETLGWFSNETEGSVLGQLAKVYWHLRANTEGRLRKRLLDRLGRKLFVPAYERIGGLVQIGASKELGATDKRGLGWVLQVLLNLNYRPLVKEALAVFDNEPNRADPSIREVVYIAVAKYGSKKQLSTMRSLLEQQDLCPRDRVLVQNALSESE